MPDWALGSVLAALAAPHEGSRGLATRLNATLHDIIKLNEHAQRAQLASLFDELDANADGCVSSAELQVQAPAWVALHSLTSVLEVPVHRLRIMLAGATLVRWLVGWLLALVAFHVLCSLCEFARVALGLPRAGRMPFAGPPAKSAKHTTKERALHYDTPIADSRREQLKCALMVLSGLAPLRIALAFCSFAAGVLLLNAAVRAGRSARFGPRASERLIDAASAMLRVSLYWLTYYHIDVHGCAPGRHEASLLVGNHVGLIEVLCLYRLARCPSFVTRIENLSLPLFAGVARISRAIVVDRADASSRERTLREISARAQEAGGAQLMIFPEGTCNNQQCLFRYKQGAFAPGLPVAPVAFHIPYAHFNACLTGAPTGGHELPGMILRTACQLVSRIEICFLPVYIPSEAERADPILYANNVQSLTARYLHVPTSDATLADYTAHALRHHRRADAQQQAAETRVTRAGSYSCPSPRGAAAEEAPLLSGVTLGTCKAE